MALYNMTQLKAVTNPLQLWSYADTATGGMFSGLVMVAIFLIILVALMRWGFVKALMASSFASFILSLLMVFAGVLNPFIMFTFLILLALTALYSQFTEN